MRRALLLLAFGSLAFGCAQAPAIDVDEDALIDLLVELHLADGRARLEGAQNSALRDSVLADYGHTEASFESLMTPYQQEPEALVALYSAVLDRLNQERVP